MKTKQALVLCGWILVTGCTAKVSVVADEAAAGGTCASSTFSGGADTSAIDGTYRATYMYGYGGYVDAPTGCVDAEIILGAGAAGTSLKVGKKFENGFVYTLLRHYTEAANCTGANEILGTTDFADGWFPDFTLETAITTNVPSGYLPYTGQITDGAGCDFDGAKGTVVYPSSGDLLMLDDLAGDLGSDFSDWENGSADISGFSADAVANDEPANAMYYGLTPDSTIDD